jgi:hypothetical protein
VASVQRSVDLNPNYAHGHFCLAVAELYVGDAERSLRAIDTFFRFNPAEPQRFARLGVKASALFLLGRYSEAAQIAEETRGGRWFHTPVRVLAACYAQLGALEKARAAVQELLARNEGDTTIAEVVAPFLRREDRDHYVQALRKAGCRTSDQMRLCFPRPAEPPALGKVVSAPATRNAPLAAPRKRSG